MPQHTPQERARRQGIAQQPVQTGGGQATVEPGAQDPGFEQRRSGLEQFLSRPEVQAGLLQFAASVLQPGANLGGALGQGFAAVGRQQALSGERAAAQEEQQFERGVTEQRLAQGERGLDIREQQGERRLDIAERGLALRGRGGTGGAGGVGGEDIAEQRTRWREFWGNQLLDAPPGQLDRLTDLSIIATRMGLDRRLGGDFTTMMQTVANSADPVSDLLALNASFIDEAPSGGEAGGGGGEGVAPEPEAERPRAPQRSEERIRELERQGVPRSISQPEPTEPEQPETIDERQIQAILSNQGAVGAESLRRLVARGRVQLTPEAQRLLEVFERGQR